MAKKRSLCRKVWNFVWNDDSIWSWIINIILAFIIIKFILYPGIGLLLGTHYPVVAVMSGSMEHEGTFEQWWGSPAVCNNSSQCAQKDYYAQYGITKQDFEKYKLSNGFKIGDIIFLKGAKPADIKKGDIIVFKCSRPDPIIHRVVMKWQENGNYYFQTKGDHNQLSIQSTDLNELKVLEDQIVGKAVFKIPWLGWIKLGFVKLIEGFR